MIREGFQAEFDCGHKMVYDKFGDHGGPPEIGQDGWCRQCPEPNGYALHGDLRKVVGLRQCWIETTTKVHFENPCV
jgi:hypothetical protein